MTVAAQLAQGLAEQNIGLPGSAQQRLIDYLALLRKWNRTYNLTAVREPQKMLSHHLLDCLAVLPHVAAQSILDVGSGAGLPGIPLAIALPDAQVTLIDSSHKKSAFLKQAAIELGLENVTVICQRIEAWHTEQCYDLVISRAFSDLREFVAAAGRFCAQGGVLAAMKGVYPDEELAQVPREFRLEKVVALKVSRLGARRHLVLLWPV